MKKILLLLSLSIFSLCAMELNWAETYQEALVKAKAENKNIMLLITSHTCRWCRKLESETLTNEEVITRMNKDYISVHVTRGEDDYPQELVAPGVPATYFLDNEGNPIIRKVMGYWNVEDYSSFLDDVDYKLGRKEY